MKLINYLTKASYFTTSEWWKHGYWLNVFQEISQKGILIIWLDFGTPLPLESQKERSLFSLWLKWCAAGFHNLLPNRDTPMINFHILKLPCLTHLDRINYAYERYFLFSHYDSSSKSSQRLCVCVAFSCLFFQCSDRVNVKRYLLLSWRFCN